MCINAESIRVYRRLSGAPFGAFLRNLASAPVLPGSINFPNLLDSAEKTGLLCTRAMHSNRFSFAFTYRYSFTGSGGADGVLRMR